MCHFNFIQWKQTKILLETDPVEFLKAKKTVERILITRDLETNLSKSWTNYFTLKKYSSSNENEMY